ncbi:PssE/Cps14G family polysaccharide biosynthesis glycosyltransferase [Marinilactibacillus psychrotolerans]|uniref:PssE/Cps14G family polysaccharide biosynthesis glycosyltransferase n=1 Tax=Marinilactibacillus psychrotolerans TaxID=191770 RepID=UPI003883CD0C
MIFVSLGSREYPFDRLLIEIDELIGRGIITEKVYAQIGQSPYTPVNYDYERFLSVEDFVSNQNSADLIISHGGTGALVGALKKNKQVIAVPRLAKYGEHLDDHQLQVSTALSDEGYLISVLDIKDLESAISKLKSNPINKKFNKPSKAVSLIKNFLGTKDNA